MHKSIISLNSKATYKIDTITGQSPNGLVVDKTASDIIVTANEMFLVSISYGACVVAVVVSVEQK